MEGLSTVGIATFLASIIGPTAIIVLLAEGLYRARVRSSKALGIRPGTGLPDVWSNILLLGVGFSVAELIVFAPSPEPSTLPDTRKWLLVCVYGVLLAIGLKRLIMANRFRLTALGLTSPKDQMCLALRDGRHSDVVLVGLSRMAALAVSSPIEGGELEEPREDALNRLADYLIKAGLTDEQLLALKEDQSFFVSGDTGPRKVERTCKAIRKAVSDATVLEAVFRSARELFGDGLAATPVMDEIRSGLGVEGSADVGWAYPHAEEGSAT